MGHIAPVYYLNGVSTVAGQDRKVDALVSFLRANGLEVTMRNVRFLLGFLFVVMVATAAGASETGSDHPLVGRFEDARIVDYEEMAFDEYLLLTQEVTGRAEWGDAAKAQYGLTLEGRVTRITYESPRERSTLEVMRAYREALTANDFEILFECDAAACGGRAFNHAVVPYDLTFSENHEGQRYVAAHKAAPEGDVHVAIYTVKAYSIGGERNNRVYTQVDVIEQEPRETEVVVVEADEMAEQIAAEGRVALYGIYFDTDGARIQAESRPALDEVGELLSTQSDLRLLVVGHTDNQGGFDYNIDLSQRRAAAVVEALATEYGVARDRLKPWGVGFTAPVASNATNEGRASNRRVELVPQ